LRGWRFLFNEERFRSLGLPCSTELLSKWWFEVKGDMFKLRNIKIDVRRATNVGLKWYGPISLDLAFDIFRC
jgi:hypothetical protein